MRQTFYSDHTHNHLHILHQPLLTITNYALEKYSARFDSENISTTICRTEEATGAGAVEDTQMGTMITADILEDSQEVETILQPIPAGMTIQGLEVAV